MSDLDLCSPLTDEKREQIIDTIAEKVVGKHLETPAVLFLDMHKPLSWIAGQTLMVGVPLLGMLFGAQPVVDFGKMLMERENIDKLITRIEDMSAKAENAQEKV